MSIRDQSAGTKGALLPPNGTVRLSCYSLLEYIYISYSSRLFPKKTYGMLKCIILEHFGGGKLAKKALDELFLPSNHLRDGDIVNLLIGFRINYVYSSSLRNYRSLCAISESDEENSCTISCGINDSNDVNDLNEFIPQSLSTAPFLFKNVYSVLPISDLLHLLSWSDTLKPDSIQTQRVPQNTLKGDSACVLSFCDGDLQEDALYGFAAVSATCEVDTVYGINLKAPKSDKDNLNSDSDLLFDFYDLYKGSKERRLSNNTKQKENIVKAYIKGKDNDSLNKSNELVSNASCDLAGVCHVVGSHTNDQILTIIGNCSLIVAFHNENTELLTTNSSTLFNRLISNLVVESKTILISVGAPVTATSLKLLETVSLSNNSKSYIYYMKPSANRVAGVTLPPDNHPNESYGALSQRVGQEELLKQSYPSASIGSNSNSELFASMPKSASDLPALVIEIEDMTKETDDEYNEMKSRGSKSCDDNLNSTPTSSNSATRNFSFPYAEGKVAEDKNYFNSSDLYLTKLEPLSPEKYNKSHKIVENTPRESFSSKDDYDDHFHDDSSGDLDEISSLGSIKECSYVVQMKDDAIPEVGDYKCDDENSCFGAD